MNLSDEQKQLIEYFEQVLGVKNVIVPASAEVVPAQYKIHFFVEDLESYTAAEKELLGKMIQAMRLQKKDYQVLNLQESKYQDVVKIVNSGQVKNMGQSVGQIVVFKNDPQKMDETYSPRRLLKEPAFKKIAWDFLQKRMSN